MAADVSYVVNRGNSEILITRDLLGGLSSKDGSNDLDLALHLPLDHLKSEMMYQQRCNSPDSPLSSLNKKQQQEVDDNNNNNIKTNHLQSNFKVLEESYLELKLLTSSQSQSSVCTLDKVKSALQRAEQESSTASTKKRSSLSSTMSSSDRKGTLNDDDVGGKNGSSSTGLFAAACPGCLMFVMTIKGDPKCPRCNSTVPSPFASVKKPRLDLNTSSM